MLLASSSRVSRSLTRFSPTDFLRFFANKWSTDWDALPHCSGGGGGGGMPRHSTAPGCELQKVPSGSEDLVAWLVQSNRILSKPYSHFFAPASSSIYIYNCAERVCSIAYLKKHTSKLRCILPVAVTRSSSYQNAILYVLPVSWWRHSSDWQGNYITYSGWKDIFFGKHEHCALWLLICGAIEKNLLIYLLTLAVCSLWTLVSPVHVSKCDRFCLSGFRFKSTTADIDDRRPTVLARVSLALLQRLQ